jgi:hypothetical protein
VQLAARCSKTGATRLPDRSLSSDSTAPAPAVPPTTAVTAKIRAPRPTASSLTASASTVGRMCHSPNTAPPTAVAKGSSSTRRSAPWSTPRNAISSQATVPTGMRTSTW